MNIYKLERTDKWGYDDYDSFVCYANNEDEARHLCPSEFYEWKDGKWQMHRSDGTWAWSGYGGGNWVKDPLKDLTVTLLGFTDMPEGTKPQVILASYNAG